MSINVAILGATGVVGQKAIALLNNHPFLKVEELVASGQRIGVPYAQACSWREPLMACPKDIQSKKIVSYQDLKSPYVLSCLPGDVAEHVEPFLANQGKIIFSNASTFRMDPSTPLLVPEINEHHLNLLKDQKTRGKIITNPNCSAVGITLALAPLRPFGIDHVSVVTLQSLSGAGYPGVPSFDLISNTIPHIEGEADKITEESKKILEASFDMTTSVHRVPVVFGHVATLHITFQDPVCVLDVLTMYESWRSHYPNLFVMHEKSTHPQSARDLSHDDMRVHIGGIKQGARANIISQVVLTHNLVRGAAGAVIANIESYQRYQKGDLL